MKIVLPYHLLLTLVLGFAGNLAASAQQDVVDSTTAESNLSDEETEDEAFYPDTLTPDRRSVINDSVLSIETDKGFYYKRYLDSLLRATQIKLERARIRMQEDSLKAEAKTKRMREGNEEDDSGGWSLSFDSFFGFIIWVAALGLLGYLVYKLFLSNSSVFSRNRKNITGRNILLHPADELNEADSLLSDAIRTGNFRLAVRYLYLSTLKRLSEKKLIEIDPVKTNYEYVNEMRRHRLANEFASLTLQYEYVWYGEYAVDQNLFERLQEGFNQFNKNLGRN